MSRKPFSEWAYVDLAIKLREVAGEWRGNALLDCTGHTEYAHDARHLVIAAIQRLWGGDNVEDILDEYLAQVVCDEERIPF